MCCMVTISMLFMCLLGSGQSYELPGPGILRSLKKTVTGSSQHPELARFALSFAVDGSTSRDSSLCRCCASTLIQNDPWIQIDLGRLYRVETVEVIGRTDLDDPFNMVIFVSTTNTILQGNTPTQPTLPDVPEQYHNVTFSYPVIGQFVTLQLNGNVGLCVCEVNIYSKDCSNGTYGLYCNETCGQCQDRETCDFVTGRCTRCIPGYQLPLCTEECMPGTFGPDCFYLCHCKDNTTCDHVNGSCPDNKCDVGWQGSNCLLGCLAGRFGDNCSSSCHCLNNQTCDPVTGMCPEGKCARGWEGTSCSNTLISLNANVTASSIHAHYKFALSRAVDGSTSMDATFCLCCAATSKKEEQPWIQIDLGRLYRVATVEVSSRIDFPDGVPFAGMHIYLHEKRNNWIFNHGLDKTIPDDGSRYYIAKLDFPVIAQFVTLLIPENNTWLVVCEVSVFSSDCSPGTYGLHCNETCGLCQNGETCDHVTGTCVQCLLGYQYPLCKQECLPGSFGTSCSSTCHCEHNLTCNHANGSCPEGICDLGWHGSNCSQECPPGTYGLRCNKTCGQCQNNQTCNHVTGNCEHCTPGYQFPLCKEKCPPGRFGHYCAAGCSCHKNQTCHHVTGECQGNICDVGWMGPNCSTECDNMTYGINCAEECGHCYKLPCDRRTGECSPCSDGYTGPRCMEGIIRLSAAAGMQVSMSSVHAGMDATRAIDGHLVDDPETCGCCSETTNEYSSWWQVDLGKPFFLKKVIVYGRLNENVFRQLVGFSILTSLTDKFPDNPAHIQNGEIQNSKVAVLLSDVAARYVRIQRLGILTICEVELVQSDIICPTYTYGRSCAVCGACKNGTCDRITGDCPSGCHDGYDGNRCEKPTVYERENNDVIIGVIGAGVGVVTSLLVVALIVALFRYKRRRIRIYEEPSVSWSKEPTKESAYATLENQEVVIGKEGTYENPM